MAAVQQGDDMLQCTHSSMYVHSCGCFNNGNRPSTADFAEVLPPPRAHLADAQSRAREAASKQRELQEHAIEATVEDDEEVALPQVEEQAAVAVQCAWRQHEARHAVQQRRQDKEEGEAAQAIQSRVRGMQARKEVTAKKEAKNKPIARELSMYQPYVLQNADRVVVSLPDGIAYLEMFKSLAEFESVIQQDFPRRKIKSMRYATKAAPNDFNFKLQEFLFDDIARYRFLQNDTTIAKAQVVSANRAHERQLVERQERLDKEAAERAKVQAAKRAAAAAAEEAEEEPEDDEEQEDEDAAIEKELEAHKKAERAFQKDINAQEKKLRVQEAEMKTLHNKLVRFLEFGSVSVEFGSAA
eukprot:NODE_1865_length_1195_cov_72.025281_g1849_i0.p1 GENE.NODE_1865_length_1195_cov_72.025281_g1849_i0~~NODE_1865_length_1195_cov_72.025281_g1849_i0.p1  ORF type:complete len:375 (+),score=108.63 NODE_1865_length_1195_cov_72.025281_g1849_i0:59-1126(+)